MGKALAACLVALAPFSAALANNANGSFPGIPNTERVIHLKKKADRLFEEGSFRKAHFVYWTDLAPYGDKYSQYMVGFHLLHGLGVTRDRVEALAWFRLAAERGNPMLIEARDLLRAQLERTELERADDFFAELQEEYGDRALLQRLVRQDLKRLRSMAGTRIVGGISGPGRVILADGSSMDMSNYAQAIKSRMERRLEYLRGYVDYGELELIEDEYDRQENSADPAADE